MPIATFFDRQQGASVGGPLARNRAFFFANIESRRRATPVGYSLDGSSGVDFGRLAEARRIAQIAGSRYGYDIPSGFGEIIRGNPNDRFFARTDVNLSPGHRLSLRHNYVNGTAEVGSQSNFRYRFTDNFYLFESATNSTVGQLDSTFGNAGEPGPHQLPAHSRPPRPADRARTCSRCGRASTRRPGGTSTA